uniref:Uncharacterized protein n=1 Tax=Glossina pallidipes TaxID=7398 RepID=A0A1A9Z908_GLOPL
MVCNKLALTLKKNKKLPSIRWSETEGELISKCLDLFSNRCWRAGPYLVRVLINFLAGITLLLWLFYQSTKFQLRHHHHDVHDDCQQDNGNSNSNIGVLILSNACDDQDETRKKF